MDNSRAGVGAGKRARQGLNKEYLKSLAPGTMLEEELIEEINNNRIRRDQEYEVYKGKQERAAAVRRTSPPTAPVSSAPSNRKQMEESIRRARKEMGDPVLARGSKFRGELSGPVAISSGTAANIAAPRGKTDTEGDLMGTIASLLVLGLAGAGLGAARKRRGR